jgi:hypothetical protein
MIELGQRVNLIWVCRVCRKGELKYTIRGDATAYTDWLGSCVWKECNWGRLKQIKSTYGGMVILATFILISTKTIVTLQDMRMLEGASHLPIYMDVPALTLYGVYGKKYRPRQQKRVDGLWTDLCAADVCAALPDWQD